MINIYNRKFCRLKFLFPNIEKLAGEEKLKDLEFLRRTVDITISFLFLIIFFPLFILVAILVILTSRGPVFYLQERVGKKGVPFNIIKFRSMVPDAEKEGPALSHDKDPRVTRVGKFLRDYKLDELPQFINVLKGDMTIIGPRPERKYFIDQIVSYNPEFKRLQEIKPGITSLGQVKYGYARNLGEMLQRMKYDLHYVKNRSFWFDLRIFLLTLKFVVKGKDKK